MRATQTLEQEHRVIETVLDWLDDTTENMAAGRYVNPETVSLALEFFVEFADRCHHAKEEDLLFPLLEQRGVSPARGPTGCMRREHVTGRGLLEKAREALRRLEAKEPLAQEEFLHAAIHFSSLLRNHIQKEDHCVFPMADRLMTESDQTAMEAHFSRVDGSPAGNRRKSRWLSFAKGLGSSLPATARSEEVRTEPDPALPHSLTCDRA